MTKIPTLSPSEASGGKPSPKRKPKHLVKTVKKAAGRDNRGYRNPRWKGGEIRSQGRILIYSPDHPHPNLCGIYVFHYRLVMENHLNRFLSPKEIVHHINGVTDDDRVENLEVVTAKEHSMIHKSYLVALEARMAQYKERIALNPLREKRKARKLDYDGKSLTVRQWADKLSIPPSVIHMRINSGWTVSKILSTPKRFHPSQYDPLSIAANPAP